MSPCLERGEAKAWARGEGGLWRREAGDMAGGKEGREGGREAGRRGGAGVMVLIPALGFAHTHSPSCKHPLAGLQRDICSALGATLGCEL